MDKQIKIDNLDDYRKVHKLAELYRCLDYYNEQFECVKTEIQGLAANMTASDIRYAIKLSSK